MQRLITWCKKNRLELVLLPWLVPAISTLYLKYGILIHDGLHDCALELGPSGVLTLAQMLSLFASDLVVFFVLVPAGMIVLVFLFPLRVRVGLSGLFAIAVQVGVALQAFAYEATGAFTTAKMMWFAISMAVRLRDERILPIPPMDAFSLLMWVAATVLFAAITLVLVQRPPGWLNRVCYRVFGAGLVAAALTSCVPSSKLPWSPSLLRLASRATFVWNAADAEMLQYSVPELYRMYREDARLTAASPSAFTGKARGYNVLLFVLEATPVQVFDPARDPLQDMPHLRELRRHAFLSARHYTSFPATNAAVFSIFTSQYSYGPVGNRIGDRPLALPGMIRTLKEAHYKSAFYGFVWRNPLERDDRMLASFGFDKIVEPPTGLFEVMTGQKTFFGPVDYVEQRDLLVLNALRSNIRHWTSQKQPFVAAFFPEIGHDPWRELDGHKSNSLTARGHALAVRQDAWLGMLIDELRRDGALDNTIIVVTADHGMRFLPTPHGQLFRVVSHGKLDDIVIHVPLLVYVPKVLQHPVMIHWPTSHIDISPTILDLLGATSGRTLEEGEPIWAPSLAKRRLFLPMDTFGATGLYQNGHYYDMALTTRTVFKNQALNFEDKNVLATDAPEALAVRRDILEQNARQNVLLVHLLDGDTGDPNARRHPESIYRWLTHMASTWF